ASRLQSIAQTTWLIWDGAANWPILAKEALCTEMVVLGPRKLAHRAVLPSPAHETVQKGEGRVAMPALFATSKSVASRPPHPEVLSQITSRRLPLGEDRVGGIDELLMRGRHSDRHSTERCLASLPSRRWQLIRPETVTVQS